MMPEQCMKHRWLKNLGGARRLDKGNLRQFVSHRRWMKAMHTVTALRRMGADLASREDQDLTRTRSNVEFSVVEKQCLAPGMSHALSTSHVAEYQAISVTTLHTVLEVESLYDDDIPGRRASLPRGLMGTGGFVKDQRTHESTKNAFKAPDVTTKHQKGFYIDTKTPLAHIAPENTHQNWQNHENTPKLDFQSPIEKSTTRPSLKKSSINITLKAPSNITKLTTNTEIDSNTTKQKEETNKPSNKIIILKSESITTETNKESTTQTKQNIQTKTPSILKSCRYMSSLQRSASLGSNNKQQTKTNQALERPKPRTLVDQLLGQFQGIQDFSLTKLRTAKVRDTARKIINKPIIQFRRGMPVNAGVVVEIARRYMVFDN